MSWSMPGRPSGGSTSTTLGVNTTPVLKPDTTTTTATSYAPPNPMPNYGTPSTPAYAGMPTPSLPGLAPATQSQAGMASAIPGAAPSATPTVYANNAPAATQQATTTYTPPGALPGIAPAGPVGGGTPSVLPPVTGTATALPGLAPAGPAVAGTPGVLPGAAPAGPAVAGTPSPLPPQSTPGSGMVTAPPAAPPPGTPPPGTGSGYNPLTGQSGVTWGVDPSQLWAGMTTQEAQNAADQARTSQQLAAMGEYTNIQADNNGNYLGTDYLGRRVGLTRDQVLGSGSASPTDLYNQQLQYSDTIRRMGQALRAAQSRYLGGYDPNQVRTTF